MDGIALVSASIAGAVLAPLAAQYALSSIDEPVRRGALYGASALGAVGGAAALAAGRSRSGPDRAAITCTLVVWAIAIAAAAATDASARRVPTGFVRQGTAVVGVLLAIAGVVGGDFHPLLAGALVASVLYAAGLIACRLGDLGRGDTRLLLLGGLGLGHTTGRGVGAALIVATAVVLVQGIRVIAQGGGRGTHIPLGPALALGFLAAAAVA